MAISQMTKVWDHDFSGTRQCIMLALADWAGDEGGSIHPSMARLAHKVGVTKRCVQNHVKALRESGVLVLTQASTWDRPNEYRFDWSAAPKKAPYQRPSRGRKSFTPSANKEPVGGESYSPRPPEGVNARSQRGERSFANGVNEASPKPSVEPSGNREARAPARGADSGFGEHGPQIKVGSKILPIGAIDEITERSFASMSLEEREAAAAGWPMGAGVTHAHAHPAVGMHLELLGKHASDLDQRELIARAVTEAVRSGAGSRRSMRQSGREVQAAWQEALDYWRLNGYRPESIGKQLEKMRELLREQRGETEEPDFPGFSGTGGPGNWQVQVPPAVAGRA